MNIYLAHMIALITRYYDVNTTKLNKLLFFCDVTYYLKHDCIISGDDYIKLEYGPVPCSAKETRDYLVKKEFITEKPVGNSVISHILYKASPELNFENTIEILNNYKVNSANHISKILDKLILKFNAKELSDISHKYEPWISAKNKDILSFEKVKKDFGFQSWMKENNLL